jgi:hypothetical protein
MAAGAYAKLTARSMSGMDQGQKPRGKIVCLHPFCRPAAKVHESLAA